MYEMESPAAAYGIYSFKVGEGGKALAIGQEGLIEDYSFIFWKGKLQVTLIGQDSEEEETIQEFVPKGSFVDGHHRREKPDGRSMGSRLLTPQQELTLSGKGRKLAMTTIGNILLWLLDHATSSVATFFGNCATLALLACIAV